MTCFKYQFFNHIRNNINYILQTPLLLFSIAFVFWYEIYNNLDVTIQIEEPSGKYSQVYMPRKDARLLDSFFREILISDPLAYTLAGAKPMSFAIYHKARCSLSLFLLPNLKIICGWKLWQKYSPYFKNLNIYFWEEENPWVRGISCLIIADAKACRYLIDKNGITLSDPFQNVGKVPFFRNTLHLNERHIGILLGFGEGNASLYQNRTSFLPAVWDRSLVEPLFSHFAWKYCTFQKRDMSDLLLPVFAGDPNSIESKQLKEKYLTTRKKIQTFYKGRDFLSASLSLFKYGETIFHHTDGD
jgi:hypothetical protein